MFTIRHGKHNYVTRSSARTRVYLGAVFFIRRPFQKSTRHRSLMLHVHVRVVLFIAMLVRERRAYIYIYIYIYISLFLLLATSVCFRRRGNRISPPSQPRVDYNRTSIFLSSHPIGMFPLMLPRPLGPRYVRIHIYNETPSRLKQQHIQRQEREKERERKGERGKRAREFFDPRTYPPRYRPSSVRAAPSSNQRRQVYNILHASGIFADSPPFPGFYHIVPSVLPSLGTTPFPPLLG